MAGHDSNVARCEHDNFINAKKEMQEKSNVKTDCGQLNPVTEATQGKLSKCCTISPVTQIPLVANPVQQQTTNCCEKICVAADNDFKLTTKKKLASKTVNVNEN